MKKIITTIIIILIFSQITYFNVLSIESKSTIIYVDDDGGADYTKIQDAIDASSDGDIIFVYSGTYIENILVDKSLTIEGEEQSTTIIDGNGVESVVRIEAHNVHLSGFTITNSKNSSNSAGVYLSSNNVAIENNIIIHNKGYGIYGEELRSITIGYNRIEKNNYDGIYLELIEDSIISHNTIMDHFYKIYLLGGFIPMSHGLYLNRAKRITISNNVFENAINCDLLLINCNSLSVLDNNFNSNAGIAIGGQKIHWTSHNINNNWIDGKPIYYFKNDKTGGVVPQDAGEIILANCENFIVHNLSITGGDVGISLGYSSYNSIKNNFVANVAEGIYLDWSHNNMISGNIINHVWGVPLTFSSNNVFSNNYLTNNTRYGFGLWYGSENNSVYHNTISNNAEDGVIIVESSNNIISLNSIENNNQSGIELYKSNNNDIAGNYICSNLDYGIKFYLFASNNNVLHHNIFLNNSPYNGYDSGGNIWDLNDLGGNYWNDYNGTDNNGDGFGDQPYNIKGGNKDNFPYIIPISISYPDKPVRPIGPSSGKINKEITYSFCGFDSKGLYLYYLVDWGDESNRVWWGPFPSNLSVDISHIWQSRSEYNIRVKTRNVIGAESEWSDPLVVIVPKNKPFLTPIHQFLEQHPRLFPILRHLLGL